MTKRELIEALAEVEDDTPILLRILPSTRFIDLSGVHCMDVRPVEGKDLMEFALPSDNGMPAVVLS